MPRSSFLGVRGSLRGDFTAGLIVTLTIVGLAEIAKVGVFWSVVGGIVVAAVLMYLQPTVQVTPLKEALDRDEGRSRL